MYVYMYVHTYTHFSTLFLKTEQKYESLFYPGLFLSLSSFLGMAHIYTQVHTYKYDNSIICLYV
uniref:Uncharacterized protein n=1 Tax=Octopus bimaculoides TaxID=37653 RepID=A0A0L8H180_OCTBM